jgi:hypothetical protein
MKEIQLTQGQVAIVDDWRFDELNRYKWYAKWDSSTQSFRAMHAFRLESGKQKVVFMHSYIMCTPSGMVTDHINRDALDNREENLRICTNQQNLCNRPKQVNNTSGYKGVYYYKSSGKWRAQITIDRKRTGIGYFNTAIEAAQAYDRVAKEQYGDFAFLNFGEN